MTDKTYEELQERLCKGKTLRNEISKLKDAIRGVTATKPAPDEDDYYEDDRSAYETKATLRIGSDYHGPRYSFDCTANMQKHIVAGLKAELAAKQKEYKRL